MSGIKSDAIPAVNKRSCKIKSFFNYGSDGPSVLAPGRDGPCLFSGTRDGAPILPSDLRTSNVQSGPGAPTEQTVPVVPGTYKVWSNKNTALLLQPSPRMTFQTTRTDMGISLTSLQVLFQNSVLSETTGKTNNLNAGSHFGLV